METIEFSEDFVKDHGLNEQQIAAIQDSAKGQMDKHISDLKKGWDDKANKDAEGIIMGAIAKTQKDTGHVLERTEGEKHGEYLARFSGSYLKNQKAEYLKSASEYNEKVKNFEGDANLKAEIIGLNKQLDPLLKDKAAYDELLNSGVQDRYDKLLIEHKGNLRNVAFSSVKPTFHKDANKYEVNAVWNDAIKRIEDKYTIAESDGKWIGVSKENKYTQIPLEDLIKKDEDLTKLIEGRQQDSINAKSTSYKDVEGVPFKVPVDVTNSELTKLVQAELAKEGLEKFGEKSGEYSKRFSELFAKARGQKTAA